MRKGRKDCSKNLSTRVRQSWNLNAGVLRVVTHGLKHFGRDLLRARVCPHPAPRRKMPQERARLLGMGV